MTVYNKIIKFANSLQHNESKEKIISLIKTSETLEEDKRINHLRQELTRIISDEKVHAPAQEVAHQALLLLAEFKPLNDNDPITHEPIPDSDRIFVSTGHQFNLKKLVQWHNIRPLRSGDDFLDKRIINPLTNKAFSNSDEKHIRDQIAKDPNLFRSQALRQMQVLRQVLQSGFEDYLSQNYFDHINILLTNVIPGSTFARRAFISLIQTGYIAMNIGENIIASIANYEGSGYSLNELLRLLLLPPTFLIVPIFNVRSYLPPSIERQERDMPRNAGNASTFHFNRSTSNQLGTEEEQAQTEQPQVVPSR